MTIHQDELVVGARALWDKIAQLTDNYSEVSFEHLMVRPRYTGLKDTVMNATRAVLLAAQDCRTQRHMHR